MLTSPVASFCHFLLLWLGKSQFLQHNQTFESWPKSFLKLFTDYPSHDWWAKRNIFVVVVQELKYVEGSEFILQFGNYLTSKYFLPVILMDQNLKNMKSVSIWCEVRNNNVNIIYLVVFEYHYVDCHCCQEKNKYLWIWITR